METVLILAGAGLLWLWSQSKPAPAPAKKVKQRPIAARNANQSPAAQNQQTCTVSGYPGCCPKIPAPVKKTPSIPVFKGCCSKSYTAYQTALKATCGTSNRVKLTCCNPNYGVGAVTSNSPYPCTQPIVTPADPFTRLMGVVGKRPSLTCAACTIALEAQQHAQAAAAGDVQCCGWPEFGSNSNNGSSWWEYEDGSMFFISGPHAGLATGAVAHGWAGSTSQAAVANSVAVSDASKWSTPW